MSSNARRWNFSEFWGHDRASKCRVGCIFVSIVSLVARVIERPGTRGATGLCGGHARESALASGGGLFKKGIQLLRLSAVQRYVIIDRWSGYFPVFFMCSLLGVTRSKFYAWVERGRESTYASSDRRLLVLIRSLHPEWHGILGYRRMHTCLQQQYGEGVGHRRVRRLLRVAGLSGIPKKRRRQRRAGRIDRNTPICCNAIFQQPNRTKFGLPTSPN